ncbi:uncharacterized protein BDR25DRAFT_279346 [Lindgomyces ingoldianus]|uniref:Uncharacterized protein n=1 Tax=Lindgomyces ingoldianus TaxID=673940 RepID=A0ACB6R992_9PLEO|nr:uncharacterized protein BDR25DRAFT_279346 [Lindgomyces ingoldianus]KAF2475315.1 hypothetical protein BDR25DRAFT_279346 [Lindgomyces ingoldianus]
MARTSADHHPCIGLGFHGLSLLQADQYIYAFGPGDRYLLGTPNGYGFSNLPKEIVGDLHTGLINRIVWASFGEHLDSWFVTYEMLDGTHVYRFGEAIPAELRDFINLVYVPQLGPPPPLRVQLGAGGSYVAWSNQLWICDKIPEALRLLLKNISIDGQDPSRGLIEFGPLRNVTWHQNGSYFITATLAYEDLGTGHRTFYRRHFWQWEAALLRKGWNHLWKYSPQGPGTPKIDLAHVAINPHSPIGDDFLFIMKQLDGRDADFVLHIHPNDIASRLTEVNKTTPSEKQQDHQQVIPLKSHPRKAPVFKWAKAKCSGRSHKDDIWELNLVKGEKVKVLQEQGDVWCVVEDTKGRKGWVPRIYLDFKMRTANTPEDAYALWKEKTTKVFSEGNAKLFPDPSSFMDLCTKPECRRTKNDGMVLQICIHDLGMLLGGSGRYSYSFLKDERNQWHPDKFARFCHLNHREELKKKAEELFVLIGSLMDAMEKEKGIFGI